MKWLVSFYQWSVSFYQWLVCFRHWLEIISDRLTNRGIKLDNLKIKDDDLSPLMWAYSVMRFFLPSVWYVALRLVTLKRANVF